MSVSKAAPTTMKLYRYQDREFRSALAAQLLRSGLIHDYAVYKDDIVETRVGGCRYDVIILRGVGSPIDPVDPLRLSVSVSRMCEARLQGWRFRSLLQQMYTSSGRQYRPNSLWSHSCIVYNTLRPIGDLSISPNTMSALLILCAPLSGVKVRLSSRRGCSHILMAGDMIWCAGNELELAERADGLVVCYMANVEISADERLSQHTRPAPTPLFLGCGSVSASGDSIIPKPIPTAQLLDSGAFLTARAEALKEGGGMLSLPVCPPTFPTSTAPPSNSLPLPASARPSTAPFSLQARVISPARAPEPLAQLNTNTSRPRARAGPYPLPARPVGHPSGPTTYESGRPLRYWERKRYGGW